MRAAVDKWADQHVDPLAAHMSQFENVHADYLMLSCSRDDEAPLSGTAIATVRAPGGRDLPPDAAKELPYAGIDSRFIEAESAKMTVRVRDSRARGSNAKQFAVTLHRDIDGVPEIVGALSGDASKSN